MLEELLAMWYAANLATYGEDDDPPLDGHYHYRCADCDTAGYGRECWSCGTDNNIVVGYRWGNGARGPVFDGERVAA